MEIGHYSFGRSEHNYGLENCLHLAKRHGFEARPVTPKQARNLDVLLLSCYWWEHFYNLAEFIVEAGIDPKKERPFVLVGGFQVSQNPMPLDAFITAALIGDGEERLSDILLAFRKDGVTLDAIREIPGVYVPGRRDPVDYQSVEKMQIPTDGYTERTDTTDVARVEITRGCKFKCAFCSLAFLKPYRETPIEDIQTAVDNMPVKKVALFEQELLGDLPTSKPLPWDWIQTYTKQDHPGYLEKYHEKIKERAARPLADDPVTAGYGMGDKPEDVVDTGYHPAGVQ